MPKRMQAKTKQRRSTQSASAKRKQRISVSTAATTHEEMLIRELVKKPVKIPERHLEVQELLYNSAPELRELAYKSGYSLGVEIYKHSASASIEPLAHALENAGLGRITYQPFETKSIISTYKVRASEINIGVNMHVFESGIIAGYLASYTNKRIVVIESACIFHGAPTCQFTASPVERANYLENKELTFPEVISALEYAIHNSEKKMGNDTYRMLAIKPLLNEKILGDASKFLYMAGKMMTSQNQPNLGVTLKNAARFLGIDGAKVREDRKKIPALDLVYGSEISQNHFVELSTALLSGIMRGAYNRSVRVTRKLGNKGIYNVKMQLISDISTSE